MEGQEVPEFELPSTDGGSFSPSSFRGRPLVLYFYPRDNTPGCTTEGRDFASRYPRFRALDCALFGISRDSLKSHAGFKAKLDLPFDLLSDSDEQVCALFGVMKLKNMYGKQVRGIERSTFVIDRDGRVARAWRGVKVPNHAQEVLDFVAAIA